MKSELEKKTFHFVKEYVLMAVGIFLYAFGWIGCVLPAGGVGGGAAGLSLVLCKALANMDISVQIGTMSLIINGILLLIAGFIVGWNFGIKTIYCIIWVGVAMNFWQTILPAGDFLHIEPVLAIILGGILAGIGIALVFAQGGSSGGTDIVAMIINKYRTISYGRIVMTCDLLIIGSSLLVGGSLSTFIYGYLMTVVFGYTVDMIQSGNQQSSQVLIITRQYANMADLITADMHRGVTLIDAKGWYTKENAPIVMVVCRKREVSSLLKFVRSIDPDAFITVGSVMGVYGKGFQALTKI